MCDVLVSFAKDKGTNTPSQNENVDGNIYVVGLQFP